MRPAARLVASLALVVTGVVGCGLAPDLVAPDATPPLIADVTCGPLPLGACDLIVRQLGGNVPGQLTNVDLVCEPGPCDRAGGAGTARLVYPDGRVQLQPWSYTGDPNPVPDPECLGVEDSLCIELAHAHVNSLPVDLHLLSVQVTCRGAARMLPGRGLGRCRGHGLARGAAPQRERLVGRGPGLHGSAARREDARAVMRALPLLVAVSLAVAGQARDRAPRCL